MGYQQVRVYDVQHYCKGALTPYQVYRLKDNYATTATTASTSSMGNHGTSYPIALTKNMNYTLKIPIRGHESGTSASYEVMDMYVSDGQAATTPYHYTFPYKKYIVFNVWESISGKANWTYFRCYHYSTGGTYTQTASQTWSSVDGSSLSNKIVLDLYSGKTLSGTFAVEGGGMNTGRYVYYSDNVSCPGSWKSLGDITGFKFNPGLPWSTGTNPTLNGSVSGVLDYNTLAYGGVGRRYMYYQEYAHRLKHISVYVRNKADGAPTNNALTSNSGMTVYWYYTTYSSCSSNCNNCSSNCINMCSSDYT